MNDIERLKKLAGVNEFKGFTPYTFENMSATATDLKQKERDLGLKPGDEEWFKLWFSTPMTAGFRGRKKK
jgi:hypothetical protein